MSTLHCLARPTKPTRERCLDGPVLGVAGLGFLPIPEQIMLRQLLVREGTQHQGGMMASENTVAIQALVKVVLPIQHQLNTGSVPC